MIFTHHIQPCAEIFNFMTGEFAIEMLIDIHDSILRGFRLSKVLETNTIYELHIP